MHPVPSPSGRLPRIFVDADGCPVKEETFRVARRHGLLVIVVANSAMRIPGDEGIDLVVVGAQPDAADDWIVGQVRPDDIVVTGDTPLAARCLEGGARAITPRGRVFTEDSIGDALARREIAAFLRDLGNITQGPAPFQKRDRSQFVHHLHELIQAVLRGR
ncbi:YaiI/YqxD family protein [Candidatus Fermentibacteria bacterium]|nr:YaiI/YqxD family protein [Candidatus Fermentibacteria bacterium]